jgi:hypothetical protein
MKNDEQKDLNQSEESSELFQKCERMRGAGFEYMSNVLACIEAAIIVNSASNVGQRHGCKDCKICLNIARNLAYRCHDLKHFIVNANVHELKFLFDVSNETGKFRESLEPIVNDALKRLKGAWRAANTKRESEAFERLDLIRQCYNAKRTHMECCHLQAQSKDQEPKSALTEPVTENVDDQFKDALTKRWDHLTEKVSILTKEIDDGRTRLKLVEKERELVFQMLALSSTPQKDERKNVVIHDERLTDPSLIGPSTGDIDVLDQMIKSGAVNFESVEAQGFTLGDGGVVFLPKPKAPR